MKNTKNEYIKTLNIYIKKIIILKYLMKLNTFITYFTNKNKYNLNVKKNCCWFIFIYLFVCNFANIF